MTSTKHDLSHILLLDHTTALGPTYTGAGTKLEKSNVRGTSYEIEATLDAYLQIKQWDRSMKLLRQLSEIYAEDVQQLQRLYNKVLDAMVFDHIWNRSTDNISEINGWVDGVMKKAKVPPNAETFALKIKAAMATLQGSRRDRTVRRYWNMAKEYNVDWEVASLRDILSDSDLGKLSEISPLQYEYEPEEMQAEDNIAVSEGIISQPNLPEVLQTPQKGLGMYALRQSLSLFNNDSRDTEWSDTEHADQEMREEYARQRQTHLERDALTSAAERWKIEHEKMMKIGVTGSLSYGKVGALMWTWQQRLSKSLHAELEKIKEAEQPKPTEMNRLRLEYGPFLRLLEPDVLAALTVTSVISTMTKLNVHVPIKLATLVTSVGRIVEQEVDARVKQQKGLIKKTRKGKETPDGLTPNILASSSRMQWSTALHGKVGSILCELLFDAARISFRHELETDKSKFIEQPAFERKNVYNNGRRVGMIAAHPETVKLLTKEPVADVLAKQLPMVCEPKPWTGFSQGGYIEIENPVLRIKNVDTAQKEYTAAAAERGDLDQIFKGLDVLGQTGWKINPEVFKVMLDAWNTGEAIANLPPLGKVFPTVEEPGSMASPREKYEYFKSVQAIKNEQSGLHSNRCFQNFQMEIAKAYLHETFYLPHNLDFRGRAYPIPPYLNQMGADNARGLLVFAQGKTLGPTGLRWLKIHLANLCGYDKASLSDRASFADEHMDDIRDSVLKPLAGRRWWLSADDPWQCLATCHELVKAIDSGKPEDHVSHLPIHQDGTCNGLQHYAALGGDIAGARQVNLEPGDRPADVYTGVAELVKAEVKKDAAAGNFLAKELDNRVTRKIVKQTVMTNVYGVTFTGARLQVRKQLDDLLPDLNDKKLGGLASTYIAKKIFKGLGTLFNGAHEIQYWFGDCASRITSSISLNQLEAMSAAKEAKPIKKSKTAHREQSLSERQTVEAEDFRSTVVWTTPLKLPVVQPYRVPKTQNIKTHMSSITLTDPNVTDCIDKRKQLQGFPPNFVHSLDATHMMLSAIAAKEHGLTFSAVHDSFWTHAADVDTLNLLLRDAFVRMHTEDIVGRLAEEFKLRYKGHLYLAKVNANSPVGRKVREWRGASKTAKLINAANTPQRKANLEKRRQYQELKSEFERQKLLASEDPEEVAQGQKMVTAASIFEEMNGEQYLRTQNSLGETALGKIPESQQKVDAKAVKQALQNDEIAETHDVDMKATLEPVLDPKTAQEYRKKHVATEEILPTRKAFTSQTAATGSQNSVWVWLPLTFKPVPQKGDWDIRRLKDSVYFFS